MVAEWLLDGLRMGSGWALDGLTYLQAIVRSSGLIFPSLFLPASVFLSRALASLYLMQPRWPALRSVGDPVDDSN